MATYVVVGQHPWNKHLFVDYLRHFPGEWHYTQELSLDYLDQLSPRYIFFLHWSHIVPKAITDKYECVCFHPSHLPYGRGGTPIQNLIVRGFRDTYLTAFRMTGELDAGPIYYQEPLSLRGSLYTIFKREMWLAQEIIYRIIKENPIPSPQEGEPTVFSRRKPEDSDLQAVAFDNLYDLIRMLDAPGYPHAFIETEDARIKLTGVRRVGSRLIAKAVIEKNDD